MSILNERHTSVAARRLMYSCRQGVPKREPIECIGMSFIDVTCLVKVRPSDLFRGRKNREPAGLHIVSLKPALTNLMTRRAKNPNLRKTTGNPKLPLMCATTFRKFSVAEYVGINAGIGGRETIMDGVRSRQPIPSVVSMMKVESPPLG